MRRALSVLALAAVLVAVAAVVLAQRGGGTDPDRGAAPAGRGDGAGAPPAGGEAELGDGGGDAKPADGGRRLILGPRVDRGYPIPVRRVRIPRPHGRPATGLLLVPPGDRAPMAAAVYLHGSGADSEDFVFEAAHLAARGTVALSVDDAAVGAPPVRGGDLESLRADRRRRERTVADLRRAVDALAARPDVDADRIAFVGFSRGGNTGALLAAREPRLAAMVFIGTGGDPGAMILGPSPFALTSEGRRLSAAIDPVAAVARDRSRRPRLVQYGIFDDDIGAEGLAAFARAVREPKTVQRYRAGHPINLRAMRDRLDWLSERLGVEGPAVPGAPTSPPADR